MRTRSSGLAAAIAALAVGLAGCPSDECPIESPQVSDMPGTCTEVAGEPVTWPVQLCPTCNQTGASCVPDTSAVGAGSGDIFLDIKVEACTDASGCPGGIACEINATTCSFTAPAVPGTYTIIAIDGVSGQTVESQLVVIAPGTGGESCALGSL